MLYLNAGQPEKSASYINMFEKKRLASQEASWLFPLRISLEKSTLFYAVQLLQALESKVFEEICSAKS